MTTVDLSTLLSKLEGINTKNTNIANFVYYKKFDKTWGLLKLAILFLSHIYSNRNIPFILLVEETDIEPFTGVTGRFFRC